MFGFTLFSFSGQRLRPKSTVIRFDLEPAEVAHAPNTLVQWRSVQTSSSLLLLLIFPKTAFTLAIAAQGTTSPLPTLLHGQVQIAVVIQDLFSLLQPRRVEDLLAIFALPRCAFGSRGHLDAATPLPGDGRIARMVC